jgi:hypothetical protein
MSRNRLSWKERRRQAARQKQADPYTMNQERTHVPTEEYMIGDPSAWAEDPVDDVSDLDGTERDEIGMPEKLDSTYDHKDVDQWNSSDQYDNADTFEAGDDLDRESSVREAQVRLAKMQRHFEKKALQCVRIAKALFPAGNDDLIAEQALDFMPLPDDAVIATALRLAEGDEEKKEEKAEEKGEDKEASLSSEEMLRTMLAEEKGEEEDEEADDADEGKEASEDKAEEKAEEKEEDEDKKDEGKKDEKKESSVRAIIREELRSLLAAKDDDGGDDDKKDDEKDEKKDEKKEEKAEEKKEEKKDDAKKDEKESNVDVDSMLSELMAEAGMDEDEDDSDDAKEAGEAEEVEEEDEEKEAGDLDVMLNGMDDDFEMDASELGIDLDPALDHLDGEALLEEDDETLQALMNRHYSVDGDKGKKASSGSKGISQLGRVKEAGAKGDDSLSKIWPHSPDVSGVFNGE